MHERDRLTTRALTFSTAPWSSHVRAVITIDGEVRILRLAMQFTVVLKEVKQKLLVNLSRNASATMSIAFVRMGL